MCELTTAGVDVFVIGGQNELQPLLEIDREAAGCRIAVMPGLDHALLHSSTGTRWPPPSSTTWPSGSPPAPRAATPSLIGGGR